MDIYVGVKYFSALVGVPLYFFTPYLTKLNISTKKIYLIIIITTLFIPAAAASATTQMPVPGFSASPISGYVPLTVQFTDTSTNGPTDWYWYFGDGTYDFDSQNPKHTYNLPGIYTVEHWAGNKAGYISDRAYLTIKVSVANINVNEIVPSTGTNNKIITTNIHGENYTSGVKVNLIPINSPLDYRGSIILGANEDPYYDQSSIFVSGNNAYIASPNSLKIVDLSNSMVPIILSTYTYGHCQHSQNSENYNRYYSYDSIFGYEGDIAPFISSVFVSQNYAFIVSKCSNSLEIIDISNPKNPMFIGRFFNEGLMDKPSSIFVSGNYAYITSSGSNTLSILDISNPANPIQVGNLASGANGALIEKPVKVFVSGDYAYIVSSGSNALQIVDISNPKNPKPKGNINGYNLVGVRYPSTRSQSPFLDEPSNIYVSGHYAYITSYGNDALEIIDVSNSNAPKHVARITDDYSGTIINKPTSIFVSDNYAFVTNIGSNTLEILDVSDPTIPIHISSISKKSGSASLERPNNVFVNSNYVYITSSGNNALEIMELNGRSEITATNISIMSPDNIICNFDLTHKISGDYNVMVINPYGGIGILKNGFTITDPTVTSGIRSISDGKAIDENKTIFDEIPEKPIFKFIDFISGIFSNIITIVTCLIGIILGLLVYIGVIKDKKP